jgi:hypothetical protein
MGPDHRTRLYPQEPVEKVVRFSDNTPAVNFNCLKKMFSRPNVLHSAKKIQDLELPAGGIEYAMKRVAKN